MEKGAQVKVGRDVNNVRLAYCAPGAEGAKNSLRQKREDRSTRSGDDVTSNELA